MSFKRPRATSPTLSSSSSELSASQGTPKASRILRTEPSTVHPLLCTLPPTCSTHPTPLANSKDLESHYATYHAHVCEEKGCGCVFPDARLLELHQTECHDPFAAIRKDRGEKIFACHLGTCPKLFLTPKARRLHLIQAHTYPKEYFFAVTNKGVGGLLKKWGEGASMLRKEWKKREDNDEDGDVDADAIESEDAEDSHDDDTNSVDHSGSGSKHGNSLGRNYIDTSTRTTRRDVTHPQTDDTLDTLAESMSSLNLIPSSIQFGRGGARGGFPHKTQQSHGLVPGIGPTVPRGRGRGRGIRGGRGGRGFGRGGFSNENAGEQTMDIDAPQRSSNGSAGNVNGDHAVHNGTGENGSNVPPTRGLIPMRVDARGMGRGRGPRGARGGPGGVPMGRGRGI